MENTKKLEQLKQVAAKLDGVVKRIKTEPGLDPTVRELLLETCDVIDEVCLKVLVMLREDPEAESPPSGS